MRKCFEECGLVNLLSDTHQDWAFLKTGGTGSNASKIYMSPALQRHVSKCELVRPSRRLETHGHAIILARLEIPAAAGAGQVVLDGLEGELDGADAPDGAKDMGKLSVNVAD